jgi:hypothetical protein
LYDNPITKRGSHKLYRKATSFYVSPKEVVHLHVILKWLWRLRWWWRWWWWRLKWYGSSSFIHCREWQFVRRLTESITDVTITNVKSVQTKIKQEDRRKPLLWLFDLGIYEMQDRCFGTNMYFINKEKMLVEPPCRFCYYVSKFQKPANSLRLNKW